MFLVPADVLRPRRVDEHFAAEATAARDAGHTVCVVDHDAIAGGDAERAVARVSGDGPAVYRGWMVSPDRYAQLSEALAQRGITLRTSADQYRRGHELPGWYAALAAFTPTSAWTSGTDRQSFDAARTTLGAGAAVLRDYSKSMKHHWDEAAFIPDLTDADRAWAVAQRFLELRGDDFAGGLVLRGFESFTGPEARTWWIDGVCRLTTAHPDTPDQLPSADLNVASLQPVIAGLDLPFVTADLVRRTDGAWRVVELGDGQVSDRPSSTPPEDLLQALRTEGW
jgi:hypothetical protein